MKNIILLCLLAVSTSLMAQEAVQVTSSIDGVTVFLSGAQISRSAQVELKAGENNIRIAGLSQYIDPNSIQVEGNSKFVIQGVKHELNMLQRGTLPPDVQTKKDSLENLEFTLQMRQSMRKVYNAEREMVNANRSIKGNDAVILVEDLEEMADFFRNRLKEIEFKLLEIDREQVDINEDINRLRQFLNQHQARANVRTSDVLVTVISNSKQSSKIEISYMVSQAGWVPSYDIRAKDIESNLELVYKGKVRQATGVDWEDIQLTLSTGNPTVGGQAPELNPWRLYLADIYVQKSAASAYGIEMDAAESRARSQTFSDLESDEMTSGFADFVQVNENQVNTEFVISVPYDIPSNYHFYDVETQRHSVKAEYRYFSIPKLDSDAFLLADIVGWEKYNLLPGQSNIYFQGTFVGKAFIDPASTSDTLMLSMGRDKSVVIEREQKAEYCKTTMLGSKKRTSKAYEITIHNTKSQAVELTIEDQIPLSTTGDIEVEVEEMSGARYDETTGKLVWDLELAPGATQVLTIKFSVKYPKKRIVANL
ncbi:MAG: hypothetical protein ACI84C_000821 [Flavobacteriales bacterium]|jgi:uncharacterized protein (TIGR02231 family)